MTLAAGQEHHCAWFDGPLNYAISISTLVLLVQPTLPT